MLATFPHYNLGLNSCYLLSGFHCISLHHSSLTAHYEHVQSQLIREGRSWLILFKTLQYHPNLLRAKVKAHSSISKAPRGRPCTPTLFIPLISSPSTIYLAPSAPATLPPSGTHAGHASNSGLLQLLSPAWNSLPLDIARLTSSPRDIYKCHFHKEKFPDHCIYNCSHPHQPRGMPYPLPCFVFLFIALFPTDIYLID